MLRFLQIEWKFFVVAFIVLIILGVAYYEYKQYKSKDNAPLLQQPAMQLNGPLYKNVSWWVYGDQKSIAGGLQFPIMK